jgi:hypothetical protein
MDKEQKEFLTSQHKAGLRTNIQFVYAQESCMALGRTLKLMQQKRLFAYHTRKWKSLGRRQLMPTCADKPFLLQQADSRRMGREKPREGIVKYSNIAPVHATKIRRGIQSTAPYILLNKNFTNRPNYPADVRLSWQQSPPGRFGERNFSSSCRDSNQDSSVVQPSHYINWATALNVIGYEFDNVSSAPCPHQSC